jgi:hypothetical protein
LFLEERRRERGAMNYKEEEGREVMERERDRES